MFQECAAECVARYPNLAGKVHVADALKPRGAELVRAAASSSDASAADDDGSDSTSLSAAQSSGDPCSTAFVDIGGDRHAEAVLNLCHTALRKPPVLVVKCRLLFKAGLIALSHASLTSDTSSTPSLQQPEPRTHQPTGISEDTGDASYEDILANWWLALTAKALAGDGKSGSAGIGTPSWQLRHRNEKQRRRAEVRAQREREQENLLLQHTKVPAEGSPDSGTSAVVEVEQQKETSSA